MKRHLKALLLRQRGAHTFPLVLSRVDEMDEAEAEQWYRLLQNMQDDSERSARNRFSPWKVR